MLARTEGSHTDASAPSREGAALVSVPRGARGFTLIELLVVLTLIALMATLATPLLRNSVPGVELKTSAEGLRGAFRLARSAAIRDNRETWVVVDVAKGRYRGDDDRVHDLPKDLRMDLVTARTERIDEDKGRIRFYPDGTSTGGSVVLKGKAGQVKVAVDWFDGHVSLDGPGGG